MADVTIVQREVILALLVPYQANVIGSFGNIIKNIVHKNLKKCLLEFKIMNYCFIPL
jgi:hypothetical protein